MRTAWLSGLAGLLAPAACLLCGRPLRNRARGVVAGGGAPPELTPLACPPCRRGLEPIGGACRACGRSLGPHATPASRCEACHDVPKGGIDTTTALLRYRGAGRRLCHRLKYSGREELARPLGWALAARLRADRPAVASAPDLVVVPVPLHPWRRLRRGFNQAEGIARGASEALGRPLAAALARGRATPPLFAVARGERPDVLSGAFRARRPEAVAGRAVLLVDDIRTSGATLRAAARPLLEAGARAVDAAVAAR